MAKKRGKPDERPKPRGGVRADGDELTIPAWVPPTLYGVLTLFLFRQFVFSDLMLFGSDTLGMGYVVRELYAEALRDLGRIPEWAPHILGGTPFLEALSAGDSLYPPSLALLMVMDTHRALGWKLVLHVFLAGLFFFGWIRAVGASRPAALLGGAAYMLAPFLIGFVLPGHDGKIFVTALAPLLFWATERHFVRPGPGSIASIGLVVALVISTTHFQMAYFLFGGVGLYAIFRTVQLARGGPVDSTAGGDAPDRGARGTDAGPEDDAPGSTEVPESEGSPRRDDAQAGATGRTRPRAALLRFALFLVASVLGAAGAAYQFVPAAEYVTEYSRRIQTTREAAGQAGRAWSSSFSMHPEEAMSLIVPEFVGNQAGSSDWTNNTYWGRNPLKNNHEYAGLVVLLLAAVSFVGAARRQLRFFFVGLGLLSLTFALGQNTPVWGLFYALVPGIRLFRAPGMAIFLFGFGTITLASLGVDRLLLAIRERDEEALARTRKVLWIATGTVGAMALLMTSGVFTSVWTSTVYGSIDPGRLQRLEAHLPNIAQGGAIALFLSAAVAGLVWAAARARITPLVLLAGLIALVTVDEVRVDASFIQTVDFYEWATPDPNIRAILEREQGGDPYRLLSFAQAGQDVTPAIHGIELAAGHHPNDLSRYRELIGMVGSGQPVNMQNGNVRRLLNVRYILWPDIELGAAPQFPVVSRTEYGGGRPYHTLLAENGLPRARLVGGAVVRSDEEAVEYILSEAHDPAVEAVLAEAPPVDLAGGPVDGSVRWVERGWDEMTLEVQADRPALLIVADNWFPAWKASVDGSPTDVLRAYHTLRAVPVPAGESTVEMWYDSSLLSRSRLVSILVLCALLALGAFGVWRGRAVVTSA